MPGIYNIDKSSNDRRGDRLLTTMAAWWFVSRLYCEKIDNTHRTWSDSRITIQSRESAFNNPLSSGFFKMWLKAIDLMSESKLNSNKVGLKANEIRLMAKKLLELPEYK